MSLTLNKLRRLFDDSAKGIINQSLLDDVYSEWLEFLQSELLNSDAEIKSIRRELPNVSHNNHAKHNMLRDLETFVNTRQDLKKVVNLMLANHSVAYWDKLLALNQAIHVWHWGSSHLENYFEDHGRYRDHWQMSKRVMNFLSWLTNRTGVHELAKPQENEVPERQDLRGFNLKTHLLKIAEQTQYWYQCHPNPKNPSTEGGYQ